MSQSTQTLIRKYTMEVKRIYVLLDLPDIELKKYSQKLSYMTYDFNLDHDIDLKPIVKNEAHFQKWILNYPFYANVQREGVVLYGAA